jgi:hypothetical protein
LARPLPAVLAIVALGATLDAGELDLRGALSARGLVVESQRSWIEGGFGRLTEGAESAADAQPAFRGRVQLGLDWRPSPSWLFRVHGTYQGEPADSLGRPVGLAEAFAQLRLELDVRTTLRVRAGLFFPPTSLENVDPLWQSPYTITLSAWNTWIGEEVRLTGLDSQVSWNLGTSRLEVAAAGFALAEPSGALLAWRGFALGDRLTTVGEFLPLPPLRSFERGEAFADQTSDGTRPIDDLDGRIGWHARTRWARGDRTLVQAAYTQNGGDRRLYSGQYSWDTRYGQAGLELPLGSRAVLVAEGAVGTTTMGPQMPGGPFVDVRFRTGYALVSWAAGAFRLTARADGFENRDRDATAEPDGESGWALTGAGFWRPAKWLRLGLEYVIVRADRPAAQYSGHDPDTDARRALAEVRVVF